MKVKTRAMKMEGCTVPVGGTPPDLKKHMGYRFTPQ